MEKKIEHEMEIGVTWGYISELKTMEVIQKGECQDDYGGVMAEFENVLGTSGVGWCKVLGLPLSSGNQIPKPNAWAPTSVAMTRGRHN